MQVLIIDDEPNIRRTTSMLFESLGHEVVAVANSKAAIEQVNKGSFDVAFLDLNLDDENGLELLPKLLEQDSQLVVVVFTACASVETAVEAMRLGAADFIPKPFTPDQIRRVFERITKTRRLEMQVADLESRLSLSVPVPVLDSDEPATHRVLDVALKAAATPATLLLLGESGTGKSMLAKSLHENSPQRVGPFITASCPSLSRELLESELFGHVKGAYTGAVSDKLGKVAAATGGTLFLVEIGELPLEIQPKLLRLLQEREYERVGETRTRKANVRIIAATNRDLEAEVKAGHFREDLFYRLNVIAVHVPPLRERRADILKIARGYLSSFAQQCGKKLDGFGPECEQAMQQYAWPGNIRELRNYVERAVILSSGSRIELIDLPEKISRSTEDSRPTGIRVGDLVALELLEQEHIQRVMEKAETIEAAARILGVNPATLYRKRKRMTPEPG